MAHHDRAKLLFDRYKAPALWAGPLAGGVVRTARSGCILPLRSL
jgi:hypothetical protein